MSGPEMVVFRILRAAAPDATAPVRNPEGRFHHTGQWALYASLSARGAGVALARYRSDADPARVITRLLLGADTVAGLADLTDPDTCATFGIAPADITALWEADCAAGRRPATWDVSDRLRATGASGMLYASRQSPDLRHVVLFAPAGVRADGPLQPWP